MHKNSIVPDNGQKNRGKECMNKDHSRFSGYKKQPVIKLY